MAAFDPAVAIGILESHAATALPDAAARDAFMKEARARLGARSAEDRREAAKMGVETAKLFITIHAAALVATGTFVQFARTNGVPWISWTMLIFGLTALALFASMVFGFNAISAIYKRGEGREAVDQPPWSTAAVSGLLNRQGWFGMAGLALLVAALVSWANASASPSAVVAVTMTGGSPPAPARGPLRIAGTWTSLELTTAAGQTLTLPQGSAPVTVECR